MIIDALSFDSPQELKADICIVGAGVAGIVLANELKKTNKKIILLESGGEDFSKEKQALYLSESRPEHFPDTSLSRLRMLGGSSNHWENSTERFDPIDFEKREWVANSGWPIEYADLERHYLKAENYCGVHADGYKLNDWKKRLDIPDICQDSEDIETAIIKVAIPNTLFFLKYGKDLDDADSVRVIKNADLTDIEYDSESERISKVFFSSSPGKSHVVDASVFVLCLGGIENIRMLLHFNEKYSGRLGNSGGNVGRYFMEHPVIRAAQFYPGKDGLPDVYTGIYNKERLIKARLKLKEKTQFVNHTNNLRLQFVQNSKRIMSHGISSMHILSDSIVDGEVPDYFGKHLMNILGDIDLIADSLVRGKMGQALFDSADDYGGYQLLAMIEQSPEYDNRITLGESRDRYGLRRVEIDWKVSESDKKIAWKSLGLLARDPALLQYGRLRLLRERESRIWGSQLGFSQHHMGGTRMSKSVEDGVVDSKACVFGTKNLFVGGSSVFPTGGHVPPTLTIVAMAIKMASDIAAEIL